MRKFNEPDETRKELHEKFKAERGAISAFCREKGITKEWLRLVFIGEYDAIDMLLEAADFLPRFKAEKQSNRREKEQLLTEKVAALS